MSQQTAQAPIELTDNPNDKDPHRIKYKRTVSPSEDDKKSNNYQL